MNTIKTFNKAINSSYNPESTFLLWQEYREQIKEFLSKQCFDDQTVLVIGAGHLNDLDLHCFEHAKQLTFLDIDIEATQLGYERQQVTIAHTFVEHDVTGLNKTSFLEEIYKTDDPSIMKKLFNKYQTITEEFPLESYDNILVLPIYTQLLLPQLLPLISSQDALEALMTFIAYRIQIFNQQVKSHLRDKGHLIVFSDILQYNRDSEEAQYIKAHQKHDIILMQHVQNYLDTYGHGLGSYGLSNVKQEMRSIRETTLYWPFDEEKILLVQGIILKNSPKL